MGVFSVIWHNLWGFDTIILVLAVFDGVLYYLTRRAANRLYDTMNQRFYVPSRKSNPESMADSVRSVEEEEIVALRKTSEYWYSLFANVTAIFPLLGILGTVISLLPMVANMSDMQQNFFAALTSTFWGLVFAILFKLLDGLISSHMEYNDKSVALYLERFDPAREAEKK